MRVEKGVKIFPQEILYKDVDVNEHYVQEVNFRDGLSHKDKFYYTVWLYKGHSVRLIAQVYCINDAIKIAKLLNQDNGGQDE